MKIIARIESPYKEKFGIPRQSGIADTVISKIIFEPEFRVKESLKGIEEFSHLWLIWSFSEVPEDEDWHPTVRPPRLGANKRIGVFATRSPYRPNRIGLSSVKLIGTENTENNGLILLVSGADLLDSTPIYDIKPYIAFTDSHPDAVCGFTETNEWKKLKVIFTEKSAENLDTSEREKLEKILSEDPRPKYQNDENRIYGISYKDMNIKFSVKEDTLTVTEIKSRRD